MTDEFNALKSKDLDSGVRGSCEDDGWDCDALDLAEPLTEGFVVFEFGVAAGPFPNHVIKLFCLGSALDFCVGAMLAGFEVCTEGKRGLLGSKNVKAKYWTRWCLFGPSLSIGVLFT